MKTKVDINVFVYGTLRFGEHNFKRNFSGRYYPDEIYENAFVNGFRIDLNDCEVHSITVQECKSGIVPYAVKVPFKTLLLKGHLFRFVERDRNDMKAMIDRLDYFEGHPYAYKRRMETVTYMTLKDNHKCKGIMYEYKPENKLYA